MRAAPPNVYSGNLPRQAEGLSSTPELPPKFLRSGRSPRSAIFELDFYEAADGELTHPAISRRRDVPKTALINGWFVPVTRR